MDDSHEGDGQTPWSVVGLPCQLLKFGHFGLLYSDKGCPHLGLLSYLAEAVWL
jgi:hypothetical protein